ncbi:hypothetical protein C6P42_000829 [Pichia californica]|nr:hypothetical protein C6P42_000829 [[Candida] californica]
MAKKSKSTPKQEQVEEKSSQSGKNAKNLKSSNKKADNEPIKKNNREIVAQTTSWTGKLPATLLHEHCQKQKWGKVEYEIKKLNNGFISNTILTWENPKTKELIKIKFYPLKELIKPQETIIEARHYSATYTLHRIAFNKNIQMILPKNHKNLWYDLEIERKKLLSENPIRANFEYSNDPFISLLNKRKEDDELKRNIEIKKSSLEKIKKNSIIIGNTNTTNTKKSSNFISEDFKIVNKVSFPRKVWDNSLLFDLDSDILISIENTIKNHIEWSENEDNNNNNNNNNNNLSNSNNSYKHLLEKLGFRKIHIEESFKYTCTFNDSLEWLIFHLPEDDLPLCFIKDKSLSNITLKISKNLIQERKISQLIQGGFNKSDILLNLKKIDYDIVKTAVNLTNSNFFENNSLETNQLINNINDNSLNDWLEEKNSLKIIYDSKIKDDDPPNDNIFKVLLNPIGLNENLLSFKIYKSENYPFDLCGMSIIVNDLSYTLPNYIKLSIINNLINYLFQIGAFGIPYIYTCVDWLEQNILKIIENPGPLYIKPSNKLIDFNSNLNSLKSNSNFKNHSLNRKQLDIIKIENNYKDRINSLKFIESINNRKKLPAWKMKDDIINTINNNKVCLITGETGSGKSTQIVQFILDDLNQKNDFNTTIICTQPRRISTIGLADRISDERIDKCGLETGYIIRGENKTSNQTRISFVTTGVMLRMIQSVFGKDKLNDSFFKNLGYIFIDEVHERSIDSDFLLIILKKMLKNFPNLKIILMSATIDKKIFDGYFHQISNSNSIAHVHIEGRTFPIDDFYLDDVLTLSNFKISRNNNYNNEENDNQDDNLIKPSPDSKYFQNGNINYDLISELISKIDCNLNLKNDSGSILIFLPGVLEIKKCLNKINDDLFWKLPLHSALSSQEQKKIFQNPPFGKRKIIASTNIAETSITIPDAVVVIDSGRVKSVQYDFKSNNTKLIEIWASKAETKQRRGRAGRIRNGLCYKLFTKDTENKMISQPIPEIKRTKLESVYLTVKSIGIKNVYDFLQNGLDPPNKNNIDNAKRILIDIGALNFNDDELTILGRYLSMLPTDLKSGKMLIFGSIFGCFENSLTLASIGVTGSPFICKNEERDQMKKIQQNFSKDNGDMISILNAFKEFKSLKNIKERHKFCNENYLSFLRMNDIESTRLQYLNNMKEIDFIPFNYDSSNKFNDKNNNEEFNKFNRNSENMSIVKSILTASLYPQIAMVELPNIKYAQSIGGAIALDPEFKKIKYWTRNEEFRRLLENNEINNNNNENKIYPATRVFMHPSSSLFINDEKSNSNPSFIVFNDSQETSKLYIHDITPSSTISVLLFGGNISYDLSSFANGIHSRGIILDSWLPIRTWCKNAVLIGKLRLLLDKTIQARLENPNSDSGQDVLKLIEDLVKINM